MVELDLLARYLIKLRQEKLQSAHHLALKYEPALVEIQVHAHEAELCTRIHAATKLLAADPGKFIKEFLNDSIQPDFDRGP